VRPLPWPCCKRHSCGVAAPSKILCIVLSVIRISHRTVSFRSEKLTHRSSSPVALPEQPTLMLKEQCATWFTLLSTPSSVMGVRRGRGLSTSKDLVLRPRLSGTAQHCFRTCVCRSLSRTATAPYSNQRAHRVWHTPFRCSAICGCANPEQDCTNKWNACRGGCYICCQRYPARAMCVDEPHIELKRKARGPSAASSWCWSSHAEQSRCS